jgi:nucleolar protein 15
MTTTMKKSGATKTKKGAETTPAPKETKATNKKQTKAEVPATEQPQEQSKDKKSKKRTLEKESTEESNLIIQPNQKKMKLSTNLKPLTQSKSSGKASLAANDKMSAVVYLGHLPKGFDEDEVRKFFNQYGKIKRMKLFRSKNGVSKGYTFLEFETKDIAQIVAESMNGYYLMERQLVSHVVPKEDIHEGTFLQRKEHRLVKKLTAEKNSNNNNQSETESDSENEEESGLKITDENFNQIYQQHQSYTKNKQEKLNEKGIDFQIPLVTVDASQSQQLAHLPAAVPFAKTENNKKGKKNEKKEQKQEETVEEEEKEEKANKKQKKTGTANKKQPESVPVPEPEKVVVEEEKSVVQKKAKTEKKSKK